MSAREDEELQRLVELAASMEVSAEVQARRQKIDRRAQLYHLDWQIGKKEGLAYAYDTAPQYVGQRAEDKLCAQEFTLSCRAEADQLLADRMAERPLEVVDPQVMEKLKQDTRKLARDRADRIEEACRGLLAAIEAQQEVDLTRGFAHGASVYGFAGPLRIGYDEEAEAEPGVVPLYVQFLDPRALLVKPGTKAGRGPEIVIYKRRATYEQLRYEGWELDDEDVKVEATDLQPDTEVTIYDCWEKRRVKKKGKYELQIWHCIFLDGGKNGDRRFLLKPVNKALGGCKRIPYVCVPVRPAPWLHEDYAGDTSTSFLDAFDKNWELSNLTLSGMAQLVQLSVNPPTLQKTEDPVDIDAVTPGAQNQVRPNENAEILENSWARQDLGRMHEVLEAKLQKSTFSAPSFGEGNTQTSGLQTARLQQSSEEGLGATRSAVEQALAQTFNLLAMLAQAYLGDSQYVVPTGPGMASRVSGELFAGDEIFEVHLAGMTRFEQAQTASNWRSLSDPRPDGSKFISDETAREMSQVIPREHTETHRLKRERWEEVVLQEQKEARLARATTRQENSLDQIAMAVNEVRAYMAQQQAAQQMLGGVQPMQPQTGPMEPGQPQPAGVAASPLAESAPTEDWAFEPTREQY